MSTHIPPAYQVPLPLPLPLPLHLPAPAPLPPRPWPVPVPAQRRPAAASAAEPGRWNQARESQAETAVDARIGPVGAHREGGQGQSQDDDSDGEAADEAMDPRIRHIGDAVAMVCGYEQAQVVWSARIPLDPELLQETVLYVAYSPGLLDLRFETPCWDVRELLTLQLPQLRALVLQRISVDCSISIL